MTAPLQTNFIVPVNKVTPDLTLPANHAQGTLVGRVWRPDAKGPSIVKVNHDGNLIDITPTFPTMSMLLDQPSPLNAVREVRGEVIGSLKNVLANTPTQNPKELHLLAPIDLQAIKAAGVTFAASMIQRVIEDRAKGDKSKAKAIGDEFNKIIGDDLSRIKPGSPEALALKQDLQARGWWSQYLEVAIGRDAEIFTKSQPMSAVGHGAQAGLHPHSTWNNPEPEVVLAVNKRGEIVGATLGNDVNLRDFEGRSALLLGEAKDQNASCVVGPFMRLLDEKFTIEPVGSQELQLHITGEDEFKLEGSSSMSKISRSPQNLVAQMFSHHQYPDGAVLFCGTMFAPTQDRKEVDQGFTHNFGDIVTVSAPDLGSLSNVMVSTDVAAPWRFGVGHLMANLAARNLLQHLKM